MSETHEYKTASYIQVGHVWNAFRAMAAEDQELQPYVNRIPFTLSSYVGQDICNGREGFYYPKEQKQVSPLHIFIPVEQADKLFRRAINFSYNMNHYFQNQGRRDREPGVFKKSIRCALSKIFGRAVYEPPKQNIHGKRKEKLHELMQTAMEKCKDHIFSGDELESHALSYFDPSRCKTLPFSFGAKESDPFFSLTLQRR